MPFLQAIFIYLELLKVWHNSFFLFPALSFNIVIGHMTFTSQMIGWKKKLVHIVPGVMHKSHLRWMGTLDLQVH